MFGRAPQSSNTGPFHHSRHGQTTRTSHVFTSLLTKMKRQIFRTALFAKRLSTSISPLTVARNLCSSPAQEKMVAMPHLLPVHELIDEERFPDYIAPNFLEVHPGDVLNNKYQLISKLGYGRNSSVWLGERQYSVCVYNLYCSTGNAGLTQMVLASAEILSSESQHSWRRSAKKSRARGLPTPRPTRQSQMGWSAQTCPRPLQDRRNWRSKGRVSRLRANEGTTFNVQDKMARQTNALRACQRLHHLASPRA